jgi:predicted metal-binding membrane protein
LANAVRFGLAHGVHCLGCCWLLTLLLFIGGVMNLAWVALLALVVILEKQASPSLHVEKWLAGVMAAGGLLLAFL